MNGNLQAILAQSSGEADHVVWSASGMLDRVGHELRGHQPRICEHRPDLWDAVDRLSGAARSLHIAPECDTQNF
jgi:hypothetical protein